MKTKPKTDISFDSNDAVPHNTRQHVTYHRDLDVQSILVYWDTLMPQLQTDQHARAAGQTGMPGIRERTVVKQNNIPETRE